MEPSGWKRGGGDARGRHALANSQRRQGGRCARHSGTARKCRSGGGSHAPRPYARGHYSGRRSEIQAFRHARDAIAALANCVSENLAAEKAGSIEAKAPKDSEDKGNQLFTPSEAAVFASDLLASAGITHYEMEDPQETPMPSFDVVWKYANGIVAALVGYKDMGAADLDEAANEVMVDDAKNCKGTFASGKKIREAATLVSRKRLDTSCRSTGKSVEIHYTLVETGSGHLILIAHLNLGEATGDVANADNAWRGAAQLQIGGALASGAGTASRCLRA